MLVMTLGSQIFQDKKIKSMDPIQTVHFFT